MGAKKDMGKENILRSFYEGVLSNNLFNGEGKFII